MIICGCFCLNSFDKLCIVDVHTFYWEIKVPYERRRGYLSLFSSTHFDEIRIIDVDTPYDVSSDVTMVSFYEKYVLL